MRKIHIYIPTYHRFEATKKSLISILENVYSSKNDLRVYIGDNNSPQEMKDWLKSIAKENKVHIFLSEKNVGKPYMINWLYNSVKKEPADYFMSIDSDMIADENSQYNFIDEMVDTLDGCPEFALLNVFLKEYDNHLWHMGINKKKQVGKNEVMYGNYRGVAGTCLIMRDIDWRNQGAKYIVRGLYGFDDAVLMLNCVQILKKEVGIVTSVRLTHPIDTDKGYDEWKKKNIRGVDGIVDLSKLKGYFDK